MNIGNLIQTNQEPCCEAISTKQQYSDTLERMLMAREKLLKEQLEDVEAALIFLKENPSFIKFADLLSRVKCRF